MTWLTPRNFSAANFRSANCVLKNNATSAPILNALEDQRILPTGELQSGNVIEPEFKPRPPNEESEGTSSDRV